MRALLCIQCDGWCAGDVVLAVEVSRKRFGVFCRKTKVLGRKGELVDEMPNICMVEVHVLVHVGKRQWARRAGKCRENEGLGAPEEMTKGLEPVLEKATVNKEEGRKCALNFVHGSCAERENIRLISRTA